MTLGFPEWMTEMENWPKLEREHTAAAEHLGKENLYHIVSQTAGSVHKSAIFLGLQNTHTLPHKDG